MRSGRYEHAVCGIGAGGEHGVFAFLHAAANFGAVFVGLADFDEALGELAGFDDPDFLDGAIRTHGAGGKGDGGLRREFQACLGEESGAQSAVGVGDFGFHLEVAQFSTDGGTDELDGAGEDLAGKGGDGELDGLADVDESDGGLGDIHEETEVLQIDDLRDLGIRNLGRRAGVDDVHCISRQIRSSMRFLMSGASMRAPIFNPETSLLMPPICRTVFRS